jgi:hypothetical protein
MEAFLEAVTSGQEGSVGGMDFGAFREFLREVEINQSYALSTMAEVCDKNN